MAVYCKMACVYRRILHGVRNSYITPKISLIITGLRLANILTI